VEGASSYGSVGRLQLSGGTRSGAHLQHTRRQTTHAHRHTRTTLTKVQPQHPLVTARGPPVRCTHTPTIRHCQRSQHSAGERTTGVERQRRTHPAACCWPSTHRTPPHPLHPPPPSTCPCPCPAVAPSSALAATGFPRRPSSESSDAPASWRPCVVQPGGPNRPPRCRPPRRLFGARKRCSLAKLPHPTATRAERDW
jgi:hypothetical protein